MAIISKETLLSRRLGTELVDVDDEGGQVRVRGLTRAEFFALQKIEDAEKREYALIAAGMTEPQLSPDEVAAWAADNASGYVQEVSVTIGRLSKMLPEAAKEATKRAARGRRAGV